MNITWSEACQITGEIVDRLGVDHDKFDALASAIFDHRDTHWSDHEQKWIANKATTDQHVAELQEESDELHRKLKATRESNKILHAELARLRATDQLVKDSENLRHIVNKLDYWNVPTEVDGEPLLLPVDRLAYLVSLHLKGRQEVGSERDAALASADNLSQHVVALSIELGTVLRERDALKQKLAETKDMLAASRDAVEAINERLRITNKCKCKMIEVKAGDWRLFQVIDCPVHQNTIEVVF
jgi:septal ring factor EnvC (AmiA/AmiB activator)